MNWFYSLVAHNPTAGLWIITISSIIIGIFLGFGIYYLVIRLTWTHWLPIRQQRRLFALEADLLTTTRERDLYQDKYISSKLVIRGAISILTTIVLEEETLKEEPVNDSDERSDKQSTAKRSR